MDIFIVFYEDDNENKVWCGAWNIEQGAKDYVSRFKGCDHRHTIELYKVGEEYLY